MAACEIEYGHLIRMHRYPVANFIHQLHYLCGSNFVRVCVSKIRRANHFIHQLHNLCGSNFVRVCVVSTIRRANHAFDDGFRKTFYC